MRSSKQVSTFTSSLALAVALAGCGDDGATGPEAVDASNDGETAGAGDSWAITTQVLGSGSAQSYVVLTGDLDTERTLSLDDAVELPGRALGVGPTGGGAVFTTGDGSPVLTRYREASGSLAELDDISFAPRGLTTIGEYGAQFHFASASRAYYFDPQGLQVVVWNPEEMAIVDTIDLSAALDVDASILAFSQSPMIRHGDLLVMPVGWRGDDNLSIVPRAAVVLLDLTDDSVEVVTDDRCGYVRDGVMGADGALYLATEAFGAAVHRLTPTAAPPPCLLRFDLASRTYNPGFHVELSSLAGGAAAGSLVPGAAGHAYLRVLDESQASIAGSTHPRALAGQAAWQWYDVTLGDTPTAVPRPDIARGAGSVIVLDAGDRRIIPQFAPDFSRTTLRVVKDGVVGAASVEVPGLVFSLVKVR